MPRALSKREVDILEEQGLWEAHSYLRSVLRRLIRKNLPVEIRYIRAAHERIFTVAKQPEIAGKYRRDNSPDLKRIDGTYLQMSDWKNIPSDLAILEEELREETKSLRLPKTEQEYKHIICVAAKLSHRFACIHPFRNGNGRASRLLIDAILMRAGLHSIAVKKVKPQYLRAMRQADDGNFIPLENIIVDGLKENKERLYKTLRRKQAENVGAKRHHKSKNKRKAS